VHELIGTGGMGRVYRAEQEMLGRTVAVKVIHPHLSRDRTVEARFFTEAKAASQLSHPNSVQILDFGTFEGRPYMVMEFLRGQDLTTVRELEGPLGAGRIVAILEQTLAALGEAHHLGIVHRDLKPENIILLTLRAGGDFVKVVDFGLAILGQQVQSKRLTLPGMVCGSPHYMAPEHIRGDEVDGRADIYSCGVILYELLTGRPPFDGLAPHVVLAQQLNESPPDPRSLAPEGAVSEAFAEIALRALSKPVTERFQTAHELADALRQALDALPTEGRGSGYRVRCPHCRHLLGVAQKFCGQCGARVRSSSSPLRRALPWTPSLPAMGAATADTDAARQLALEWLEERLLTSLPGPADPSAQPDAAFEALQLMDRVALDAAERGDLDGCVDVLRRGLTLARDEMSRGGLADPVSAPLHFSAKLGNALALRGDLQQADGVLSEALDLGGPRASARTWLLASRAQVAFLLGRAELATARLKQSTDAAAQSGGHRLVSRIERIAAGWAKAGAEEAVVEVNGGRTGGSAPPSGSGTGSSGRSR
jgi:serine/threonine-protein kinase